MGYGDYYRELYRHYYWDPFPHSLLSTREVFECLGLSAESLGIWVECPLVQMHRDSHSTGLPG